MNQIRKDLLWRLSAGLRKLTKHRQAGKAQVRFLRSPPPVPMPRLRPWLRRPLVRTNPRLDAVVNRHLRLKVLERQRLAWRV